MISGLAHCLSPYCPELSEKTKENLIFAGKVALVVSIALGFLAAAIFTGGAAVAAATIAGAAIYGTLCGIACIGVIVAEVAAECNGIWRKEASTCDVVSYVAWAIGFPLVVLWYLAPVLIQGAALASVGSGGRR